MLYLSKLELNPSHSMVRSELRRPYEMHRTLLQAFGTDRQGSNVLHRVEFDRHLEYPTILIQATVEPDWSLMRDGYLYSADTMQFEPNLIAGRRYRFRLRACPSKKVRRLDPATGKRYNGNRNSTRYFFYDEAEQIRWLHETAANRGFTIQAAHASHPLKRSDRQIKLFSVQFDGVLEVADSAEFHKTWQIGIGPSKAFGCGLLSLAPA